jgi:hypothetical protein
MEDLNQDLGEIFAQLQECHKEIHKINEKPQKIQIINKLHEAFELSSGAFFQLNFYQNYYKDLKIEGLNNQPHTECWDLINSVNNINEFNKKALPPNNAIRSEFQSITIANIAFRLSAAGALICDAILVSKNLFKLDKTKYNKFWPFQEYLRHESDWNRKRLFNQYEKIQDPPKNEGERDLFFLMLIIALRDEYGHSEYTFKTNQEYRKKRGEIIDNHYKRWIIDAEITIMKKNINSIIKLCNLNEKPIKFNSSFF